MSGAAIAKRIYTCKQCGQPKKGHTCSVNIPSVADDSLGSKTQKVTAQKVTTQKVTTQKVTTQKVTTDSVKCPPDTHWEFEDGSVWNTTTKIYTASNDWTAYDTTLQGKLSVALLARTSNIRIRIGQHHSEYIVDFDNFIQVRLDNGFIRRIRHKDGGEHACPLTALHQPSSKIIDAGPFSSVELTAQYYPNVTVPQLPAFPGTYTEFPPYWKLQGSNMVHLTQDMEIFKEVAHMFGNSLRLSTSFRLTAIDVNCCTTRFKQYIAMKESMKVKNEMWAWHGTDVDTIKLICANGFLRDFSKTQAYGAGTYFAKSSGVSFSGYSKVSRVNNIERKAIILSRILVGTACVGSSTNKHVPFQSDNTTLYNSMVDYVHNPAIIVPNNICLETEVALFYQEDRI